MALIKTALLVGVVTLAACGGSQKSDSNTTVTVEPLEPGEAGPTLEESTERVKRMAALYTELGDGVDAAGGDCDAVATSIRGWSQANGPEIKTLNAELAAMPKDQVKELAPTLEAPMRRAALQVKDGSDRCPGHQGVFDAISGIPR